MNQQTSTSLHGTMLSIFNIGVLITAEPRIGKSELALALIDRGHQLISDDVTNIINKNNSLIAKCPDLILNNLLIHGIGMLNIADCYGNSAIKSSHTLNLIIK